MFENKIGQRPGKSSPSVRIYDRNRSNVVELVGRGSLMFAKVENGVTKSCQNFRQKNAEKMQFWPVMCHFFEQDRSLFARVEIGVTEFLTKTAKREYFFCVCLRFFSKVGA